MNRNINFKKYNKRRKRLYRNVFSRFFGFLLFFAIGAIFVFIVLKNGGNWGLEEKDVNGITSLIMLIAVGIGFLSQFWPNGPGCDRYEAAVISKVLPHYLSEKMQITTKDAKRGFDESQIQDLMPVRTSDRCRGSAYFAGTINERPFEYARIRCQSGTTNFNFSNQQNIPGDSTSTSYDDSFSGMLLRTDMAGEDFMICSSNATIILLNQKVCKTGNDRFDSRFICYAQSLPSYLNDNMMNAIIRAGELYDSPLYVMHQNASLWLIYNDRAEQTIIPTTKPFTEEFFLKYKDKTEALVDLMTKITKIVADQ